MKHTYLHDVLPFLRELEREKQKQFEAYFRTAPLWLMDLFQSEIMEAGTTFIRENEPADTIFFVARGRVKATDYRISGIAYDFMKPMNLIALGGMEVILGQDTYQTTLQTETECIVTKLPRAQYEKWIYSDTEAFRLEAKLTCASLLEEERRNRLYLFLEGADRLAVLFSEWFEKYNKNDILSGDKVIVKADTLLQKVMSDKNGLAQFTKKFQAEQLIVKKGNQICIDRKQYERLKRTVDEKIGNV